MSITLGGKVFSGWYRKIAYEGPQSDNPLAFKWHDENRVVASKIMKEHMRFAVAYWHTFCNTGEWSVWSWHKTLCMGCCTGSCTKGQRQNGCGIWIHPQTGCSVLLFHDVDLVDEGSSICTIRKPSAGYCGLHAKQKQGDSELKLL